MTEDRVVSGMRPTGALHLGHYHGALKNWVRLQSEYPCYFFVADWHALTTHYETPEVIEKNVWEVVDVKNKANWIPCDLAMAYQIDPSSILIFGGFDKQNRTNATFVFNTNNKTINRQSDLPTVGSFSTMVF